MQDHTWTFKHYIPLPSKSKSDKRLLHHIYFYQLFAGFCAWQLWCVWVSLDFQVPGCRHRPWHLCPWVSLPLPDQWWCLPNNFFRQPKLCPRFHSHMDENKRNLVYQEDGTEIKISPTDDTSALMTVSQDIKHTLREETHWLYTIVFLCRCPRFAVLHLLPMLCWGERTFSALISESKVSFKWWQRFCGCVYSFRKVWSCCQNTGTFCILMLYGGNEIKYLKRDYSGKYTESLYFDTCRWTWFSLPFVTQILFSAVPSKFYIGPQRGYH